MSLRVCLGLVVLVVSVSGQYSSKQVANECTVHPELTSIICGAKASCKDEVNGFSCQCNDGYFATSGFAVNYCEDVDECAMGTSGCDSTNGYCVDWFPPEKFRCGCNPGYVCSNTACTRCAVDSNHVCNSNNGGCDRNAVCTPLPNNQKRCKCRDGYIGDGATCTLDTSGVVSPTPAPFASCSTVEWTCPFPASNCTTLNGRPYCSCNSGFFSPGGFGTTCVDIDECRTASLNNCGRNSVCINEPGTFRCQCSSGFEKFPGSLEGRDCRTRAQIREALATGGTVSFNTGLNGLSPSSFRRGSIAQTVYITQLAATLGEDPSAISIRNVTALATRRATKETGVDRRDLQFGLGVRFEVRMDFVTKLAEDASSEEILDAYNEVTTRVKNVASFVTEDLEVAGSEKTLDFLNDLVEELESQGVPVDSNALISTDVSFLTFVLTDFDVEELFLSEFSPSSPIGGPTPNFEPSLFIPTTPSSPISPVGEIPIQSPSLSPSSTRILQEEEDNFFEVFESEASSSTEETFEIDRLWKEDFSGEETIRPKVHVVISYCMHDLRWLEDELSPLNLESITVISKCGNVPTGFHLNHVVVEAPNTGRNDGAYVNWIVSHFENIYENSVVLFVKDTKLDGNKGEVRKFSIITEVAKRRGFSCGVQPGELLEQGLQLSVSAYHDSNILNLFSMKGYESVWPGYSEKIETFKSSFSNLGEWRESMDVDVGTGIEPVCYGGVFSASFEALRAPGKHVYENILRSLNRGDNIEEGHFMERTWAKLLTRKLSWNEEDEITRHADFSVDNERSFYGALVHKNVEKKRWFSSITGFW